MMKVVSMMHRFFLLQNSA